MAYASIPEDLTKVKNKVFFNLTARQIVSVLGFGALGVVVFLLTNKILGSTLAGILLVICVLPGFLVAGYKRNGLPAEQVFRNMLDVFYLRPKVRLYKTHNYYEFAKVKGNKKKGTAKGGTARKTVSKSVKKNSLLSSGRNTNGSNKNNNNRNKKKKEGGYENPFKGMKKIESMTVQQSIDYKEMTRDGICYTGKKTFSKMIEFGDITYQLAMDSDKEAILEEWLKFLNYFDNSIYVQFSFLNHHVGISEFEKNIKIQPQGDAYDSERLEYSQMLQDQLSKGNNGLVKSKYITFSIEADTYKEAKQRLSRIETDVLNNFANIGVQAHALTGAERLAVMRNMLHPEGSTPLKFKFDDLLESGLSTKDYIAPSSLTFKTGRYFTIGGLYAQVNCLQILASELPDSMLAELLDSENELLINFHIQPIEQSRAIKLVKTKMSDINRMKIDEQKKAARNGYDISIIPSDLNLYAEKAEEMLESLQQHDECMFMVTILFMSTGKTQQELNDNVAQLNGIAQKHNCSLEVLDFMQEKGFTSSLPIGVNKVPINRGLTTSSTAVFVPFTTQELFMDDAESVYYGLNAMSSNMIMANRKALKNPNGLIFGTPGSGKSFAAKREILNVFFVTKDDIIICDPEDEYSPLVNALGGQVIKISPTSKDYINPMDITMDYSDEDDPLTVKTDSIISMYELMAGNDGVDPVEKSILNRCIRTVYQPYFDNPEPQNMPILSDLHKVLLDQQEEQAKHIADVMELYVNGSLNVFNHRTNVQLDKRVVCFNTKDLGKQLKKLGMLIVQDQVWNRVTINRFGKGTERKYTWYYIDEFHLLLKEDQTAAYCGEIWKRFRKWGGIPTGITQNVKDLLQSSEIENIFENSDFIIMLNQRGEDRGILAQHLSISPYQLSYVTNSNAGEGLLFYGNVIIPFRDHFDDTSSLYALMSTKPMEMRTESETEAYEQLTKEKEETNLEFTSSEEKVDS